MGTEVAWARMAVRDRPSWTMGIFMLVVREGYMLVILMLYVKYKFDL